jgi:hypothetical protein
MAKATVTAGAGRTVPVPTSIATAPGGRLLYLRRGEGDNGDELEVDDADTWVNRSLRNGDLERVASPRPRPEGERFSPLSDAVPPTPSPAIAQSPALQAATLAPSPKKAG